MTQDELSLGVLSRLVRNNSELVSDALEIEGYIKIDGAFPATVNLIEFLLIHLSKLPEPTNKPGWMAALNAGKDNLIQEKKWLRTSSNRNPLQGNIQRYPIAAFLLQEPHIYKKQINGVHSFFLFILINQNSDSSGLDYYANELRVSIGRIAENAVLKELPEIEDDFDTYYVELKKKVVQLYVEDPSSEQRIIFCLYKLIEKHEYTPRPIPIPTPNDISVKKPTLLGGGSTQIEVLPIDEGDPETAEPPSLISVLVDSTTSDDDDVSLSGIDAEFKTDFKAKKSEYWIRRHSRLVPHDATCFTPLEKKKLSGFIKQSLNTSNTTLKNSAGIVCLLYITGLTLDELLKINLDSDQIITKTGQFNKLIQRPEGSFQPNEQQTESLIPASMQLNLQLPDIVTQWLQEVPQANLWSVLAKTEEAAKTVIENALVSLRENGQYRRIILSRISGALALETTLKYRNPAITHYLSGRENQAAPMLSYYVAHPISEIEQAYANVVQGMLCL